MSRRRDILNSIATRLAAIPGVVTVAPWQKNFSVNKLPAIAWRDKIAELETRIYGQRLIRLTVIYGAYLKNSSSAARDLLTEILAAIGADPRHDNNARSTNLIKAEIGLQVADETISGCMAQIEIIYTVVSEGIAAETNRLQDENQNNLTDENGDNLTW